MPIMKWWKTKTEKSVSETIWMIVVKKWSFIEIQHYIYILQLNRKCADSGEWGQHILSLYDMYSYRNSLSRIPAAIATNKI